MAEQAVLHGAWQACQQRRGKTGLGVLSAKVLFDNPHPVKLSTRVAEHDGAYWYDLTNRTRQAVKITGRGWEIVDNPPLIFERHNHQAPQATPVKDGDIRKILKYINLKDNTTLFLCDLISKFLPGFPHPMPNYHGEKGSAKSTATAIQKILIDPSRLRNLGLSKDERDFVVIFREHWFVLVDNIGFITAEISNLLYRMIMGDGIQQRRLHTNAESVIFDFLRCIAVNGIDIVPTKSDKKFPKDSAALGKKLRDIMSNLRHEGIIYVPHKRKNYGVPLTLKKQKTPTLPTPSYTNSPNPAENGRFESVGNSVGAAVKNHDPTLCPTREKAPDYAAFEVSECRVYDSVGENPCLEERDGWVEIDDMSVFDMPPLPEPLE